MYFKKLEIFGFKSFADKTVLNFGSGITAIIGPNGCGKSNIFDAIRWVLGEQSIKELRGASMEDVIFNGTDRKPALGFAEVSLTFSNESRILPVDYNEVTVTRRLFRSGESEYCLNKTTVRLKDITELFMGTGIGAEAYSLIQQGKVDLVVSAKPEDRRIILDEASGITKYKAKRREALNKLKDTDANLLRINDIVNEVKRQIASMERQANRARKYKEEFEKLKSLEVALSNAQMDELVRQRRSLQVKLQNSRQREADLQRDIQELTDGLESENSFLEEVDDQINAVRAQEIKLDGQIDLNNRQVGFNEERLQNIAAQEKRIAERKAQISENTRAQQEKISELKRSLASIDEELETNQQQLTEKQALVQEINERISSAQEDISDQEQQTFTIHAQQVKLKNRLTESMREIEGGLARQRRLDIEMAKVVEEKQEAEAQCGAMQSEIDAGQARVSELKARLQEQRTLRDQFTESLADIAQRLDEREKERVFLISQKEFIEKLSVQYRDIPDPVVTGRLLTQVAPEEHHTGIIGKVREVRQFEPGAFPNIPDSSDNPDQPWHEIVCETKFVELDPQQISRRIEELEAEIGALRQEQADLSLRHSEQEARVEQAERAVQEAEKVLSVREAQHRDSQEDIRKFQQEIDVLQNEIAEVSALLENLQRAEAELTQQLDTSDRQLESAQQKMKTQQEVVAVESRRREETNVVLAQLQSAVNAVAQRKESFDENMRVFTDSLSGQTQELEDLNREREELQGKQSAYEQEIELLIDAIGRIKSEKQSLQQRAGEYTRQHEEIDRKINNMRASVTAFGSELSELRELLHREQMREQETTFKEKEIRDRLQQAYRIDLEAWNAEAATAGQPSGTADRAPLVGTEREEAEMQIQRLRKRCESFGSVNLVAIEEFEELRERFEFLTKQQSDLLSAKESLHQTITKINRQTRHMFMETFARVSEEFRIYFRMLFGGGDAQLVLMEPDNVLETGIEIIARPPGKKLQNISLLSGGEKTLTAIALVFGIFKVNPSPFCVLDEIDAALDESNVGRYSYLLKDFAKIAQFIVITHNKKTITSADMIYGITMQETGVSRVVSVNLSDQKAGAPSKTEESSETVRV